MFEAASAARGAAQSRPGFALLESAGELVSEEGQRRALRAIHEVMEWELAGIREMQRRAAN